MDKAIEILKEMILERGDKEIVAPQFEDRRQIKK